MLTSVIHTIKASYSTMYPYRLIIQLFVFFLLLFACLFKPVYSFGTEATNASSPIIRIVYNKNNPPLKFEDINGNGAGLLPDFWRLWAEKTDRRIEFIAAPWDKTVEMVRNGQADIHAGLFYSGKRDKFLDFSTTLFNLEYQVFVHDTIRGVNSLNDLYGFRVGVPKGYTKKYMEEQLPGSALAVYEDFPALYEAAIRNEIRVFVSPQFNYYDFLRHHGKRENHRFSPVFPAYNRDYLGAVTEGNQELVDEINRGMAQITPGERASLEHKWLIAGKEKLSKDTLRISVSTGYHPLTFIDGNGRASGFLVDLWRLWSEKTGCKIAFLPSTWKESIDAIASNKADIHSGLMKNRERSRWLLFSKPVYGVSTRFYYLANRRPVQIISDINTERVGVIQGTWQLQYLQKRLDKSQIVIFKNSGQMTNALRQGQIEVIFDEDLKMNEVLDRRRLRGLIYGCRQPVSRESVFAGVSRNNSGLLEVINEGFDHISRLELLELERRWIKDPSNRFYETSEKAILLKLSKNEKIWLAKHPHISVAGMADWAPIDYVGANGVQQGITEDYLRLIEERLEIVFLVNSQLPWSKKLDQIRNRETDIIANIVKTEKREKFLHFSMPYLNCPYGIVTQRPSDLTLAGIKDLAKKIVVVENNYYLHSWLQEKHPDIQLKVVDSTVQALTAISSGTADAYIGNHAVILWLVKQLRLQDVKVSNFTGVTPTLLRLGVRKDWVELVSILNKALCSITQKEHRAIQKKWLGNKGENVNQLFQHVQVTPDEQSWLDSLGPVRLGVNPNWVPLEYIDDKGEYSGMSSDFMSRFTWQLGLTMASVEKISWTDTLNGVRIKELDIVPMIIPTAELREYLNFTKPYLDFPLVVFTRHDNKLISGLEDLAGKRLAVEKGYMTLDYLRHDYPNLETVEVPTTLDALKAVSYGQADAFVGNLLTGAYLIESEGLANVKIAAPTPYRSTLSIGVRKDWPQLIPLLNKAIDIMTDADRAVIRQNWLSVRYDQKIDYSLAWKILAGAVVIVFLVLLRNREISRQKEQLEASKKQFKTLINTLPIAIMVVDYNGVIIFANAQAGHELVHKNSLVGRDTRDLYVNADDRKRVFETVADKGLVESQDIAYRNESGGIIDCQVSIIPVYFDEQNALLAVAINMTERIKIEQALEKAKIRAEEADHLKSAFLASMSHELRTPLNSIIGFTGILLQQLAGPLNDEQNKQLSMVQTSSQHLLSLINDVLDISKIEAGELKIYRVEFDMREATEKVIQIIEPMALKQGLTLNVYIAPEVGKINSDRKRVEQILINLIGNSVKFTNAGEIAVHCRTENGWVVTDVKDTGIGIKARDMDKLFQSFKQIDTGVNRIREGTGLGLSISKKLVDKLGGDIQAKSVWGTGSTFTFRLPLDTQK